MEHQVSCNPLAASAALLQALASCVTALMDGLKSLQTAAGCNTSVAYF